MRRDPGEPSPIIRFKRPARIAAVVLIAFGMFSYIAPVLDDDYCLTDIPDSVEEGAVGRGGRFQLFPWGRSCLWVNSDGELIRWEPPLLPVSLVILLVGVLLLLAARSISTGKPEQNDLS